MRETFTSAITMAFCLTIPASFGLWLLSEPVIRIIFQYGAFTALDTARTAEALRFYAVGLFAYASVKIMVPVFFALNDTRYPVVASFLAVAANLLFVTTFIEAFQHRAIALSTSCAMIGNFLFLCIVLYKKLGGYSLSYLLEGIGKVFFASLLMSGWLWLLLFFGRNFFSGSIFLQLAGLMLYITTAVAVYGAVLYFLKVKELSLIIDKVRQKLGK
jgi:putative peptidoglycan lipid II flippase